MVCKPCKAAGNANADRNATGGDPEYAKLALVLHGRCQGCDCAHVIGLAVLP